MLRIWSGLKARMLQLMNPENSRNKRWCAVLVVVAVCALTVNVATRYSFSGTESSSAVKAVQTHASPEPSRQRLLKTTATSLPVVVCHAVLETPGSYRRLAPAAPPTSELFFKQNLYNRPPPSSKSFS